LNSPQLLFRTHPMKVFIVELLDMAFITSLGANELLA
jgi:hypothetical protein